MIYFLLILSASINILFTILFFKTNKNKLIAQIILLKNQLESVKNYKGNKRYSFSIFQKIIMSISYAYLKFPKNLCFAFKPETILKWYHSHIKKFWTFPFCIDGFHWLIGYYAAQ